MNEHWTHKVVTSYCRFRSTHKILFMIMNFFWKMRKYIHIFHFSNQITTQINFVNMICICSSWMMSVSNRYRWICTANGDFTWMWKKFPDLHFTWIKKFSLIPTKLKWITWTFFQCSRLKCLVFWSMLTELLTQCTSGLKIYTFFIHLHTMHIIVYVFSLRLLLRKSVA